MNGSRTRPWARRSGKSLRSIPLRRFRMSPRRWSARSRQGGYKNRMKPGTGRAVATCCSPAGLRRPPTPRIAGAWLATSPGSLQCPERLSFRRTRNPGVPHGPRVFPFRCHAGSPWRPAPPRSGVLRAPSGVLRGPDGLAIAAALAAAAPGKTTVQVGFEGVRLRRQLSPLPCELFKARPILRIHRNGCVLVADRGLSPKVF
jgi:hypothetical protein